MTKVRKRHVCWRWRCILLPQRAGSLCVQPCPAGTGIGTGPPPKAFCSPAPGLVTGVRDGVAATSCFMLVQGLSLSSEHPGYVLGACHEMQWGSLGDICALQPLFSTTKACYQWDVMKSLRSTLGSSSLVLQVAPAVSLPDSQSESHLPYTITITLFSFLTLHSVGVTRGHPFCGIFAEGAPLGKFIQQTKEQFSNVVSSHPDPILFLLSVKHLQQ